MPYIRIQSNGLPNRCYYAGSAAPVSKSYDFEVKFNWATSSNVVSVSSVTDANTYNCDFAQGSWTKVPSSASYTNYGDDGTGDAIGFALDGLMMQPMISGSYVDDFYPPSSYSTYTYSGNTTINMDHCLSHTNGKGQTHYHAASPCLGTPSIATSTPYKCYSLSSCWGKYLSYSKSYFTSSNGLTPIGLAKDGHIIWGPYDSDGNAFDACDLDYCSGATIDGVYGYASTQYHPYLPACYGPATSRGSYQQQCTLNAPYCSSSLLLAETKKTNYGHFFKNNRLSQKSAQ